MNSLCLARFEDFTAVTMKNAVFWDVAPCICCINRRFGGKFRFHLQDRRTLNQREQVVTDCWVTYSRKEKYMQMFGKIILK
jgi:hypothetical protein